MFDGVPPLRVPLPKVCEINLKILIELPQQLALSYPTNKPLTSTGPQAYTVQLFKLYSLRG